MNAMIASFQSMSFETIRLWALDDANVESFRSWYCANVADGMDTAKASVVLKAFLVAYHFESAVPPGILRFMVHDAAKDVVDRISRWDQVQDVRGLGNAVDMFTSAWSNHHQSLKPYDFMARTIQSRFWLSCARWKTRARCIKAFSVARFNVESFRTMTFGECSSDALVSEALESIYDVYVKRLAAMAALPYDADIMCYRNARMALLMHTHAPELAMVIGPPSPELLALSTRFAEMFDRCIRGDYACVLEVLESMREFGQAYNEWWRVNQTTVVTRIEQQIYAQAFLASISHGRAMEPGLAEELLKRYATLVSMRAAKAFRDESTQMKALRRSMLSPFWGYVLTPERIMHELAIDPAFTIKYDNCYRLNFRSYADNVPTSAESETFMPMLFDMQAGVMRCCQVGGDAWAVIAGFQLDRDPSFFAHGFKDYAETVLLHHVLGRMSDATRARELRWKWDEMSKDHDNISIVMPFLFECVKELRVQWENKVVDSVKAINTLRRQEILMRRPAVVDRTEQWLTDAMARVERGNELELLQAGEPFMLMRFHDRALVDLVWDNKRLSQDTVPEIVQMDLMRIQEIRGMIEYMDDTPEMRHLFMEIMIADRVPRSAKIVPPPALVSAAKKLRRVLLVSRALHGDMITDIVCKTAARRWSAMHV